MENQETDKSLFDLSFDEHSKFQLKGAATWAGYAAIVSITASVLTVINYFVQKSNSKSYQFEGFPEMRTETSGTSNLASVVITFVIALALFYFLNKFSKMTKAGVDGSNQQLISEGLGSLSTYFRIIGVLLIICIVLVVLAVLFVSGSRV
jgi:small-conductance mechanosensitive channel